MDSFEWKLLIALVLCLGAIAWGVHSSNENSKKKCAVVMSYAQTKRDTMDALIVCQQISDAADNRMTAAMVAGIVAGSIAGRK